MLSYTEESVVKTLPAKHDLVLLFKIGSDYYILGSHIKNPIADHPIELKVSIGGTDKANYDVSMRVSLSNELAANTHGCLKLSEFDISPYYVCSRQPNWGDWSVCFVEVVCLSKNITSMENLKSDVALINNKALSFGIYKLDDVLLAATKTAGKPEGLGKEKTLLRNYLNGKSEQMVIFNDNDMAKLFSQLTADQLFIPSRQASMAFTRASY